MVRVMRSVFLFAALAPAVALSDALPPYGTCAHVSRDEFSERTRTCEMLAKAGIRYLRMDFDWVNLERFKGEWRFDKLDILVADVEKAGITILPILGYNNPIASPSYEHLDEWTNYVHRVLSRYRGHFPVVEVWNEPNLGGFWPNPNPENYTKLLKATYAAVKAEDPKAKVAICGFSQVPFDFIERIYKAGGRDSFDVMNIHPYSWPLPPEGNLDQNLDRLRKLMSKYGDDKKPIWITEIGWPNARGKLAAPGLIRAGLGVVYPGRKPLHVLYSDIAPVGTPPNPKVLELIRGELPDGSTLESCTAGELGSRLKRGGIDVVVNPLSLERSLVDSVDAQVDFIAKGGTVVLFGGSALYYSFRTDAEGVIRPDYTVDFKEQRRKFRIVGNETPNPNRPRNVRASATREAIALMTDPDRYYVGERFCSRGDLEPCDRFIPLIAGKTNDGNPTGAVVAAVYKFNGRWKGAVIASGLFEHRLGTDDELTQASKLSRALGIAFDRGVECFFNYEFRAPEKDDTDQESYFGMVHPDFTPKPAFTAYRTFANLRPSGSVADHSKVAKKGEWHVQWATPKGSPAGMIWLPGSPGVRRKLTFEGGKRVAFRDFLGKPVQAKPAPDGVIVSIAENPLYFSGAKLLSIEKE